MKNGCLIFRTERPGCLQQRNHCQVPDVTFNGIATGRFFLGIDYEFNDFIQAVHRCYRFLQKEPVILDIIYMDNEQKIKDELMAKWKNHNHMVEKMIAIVKKYGLS